ncbi:MAG: hypothetical protein ACYDCG_19840 [Candidatus Acidiferrales bacterium]
MNTTNRVFVVVEAGIVVNVDVPAVVDGTHTVIDFDLAETDAEGTWAAFDELDRAYLLENYLALCAVYFGECRG